MDLLVILEQYGIPICVAIALGFFIWKQNKFIQDEIQKELRESIERLEGIVIKLIDAQKQSLMEQKEIKASYHAIVEILSSLSGNGLKEKFVKRNKNNDRGW